MHRPTSRTGVTVVISLLLGGCASPFGSSVSYCEAATTYQHRYADARAREGDPGSVLDDAFNQVELQAEEVRDAAPDAARDDWAAVAGPGDSGAAGRRALAHADAECGTGLQAIADGMTPAEFEQFGSAGS